MRQNSAIIVVALLLGLAACHKADNAQGPGGVSMGEARALDEAASMVEAQKVAPPTAPAANQIPPGQPLPSRP